MRCGYLKVITFLSLTNSYFNNQRYILHILCSSFFSMHNIHRFIAHCLFSFLVLAIVQERKIVVISHQLLVRELSKKKTCLVTLILNIISIENKKVIILLKYKDK